MTSPNTPNSVKLIEVIVVNAGRGKGIESGDPFRNVTQYWSKEGVLLAESDPVVNKELNNGKTRRTEVVK